MSVPVCTTCGGSPHPSGRVCVCGGANTVYAEIEGLRRECMERAVRLGEYPNISPGEIAPLATNYARLLAAAQAVREAQRVSGADFERGAIYEALTDLSRLVAELEGK